MRTILLIDDSSTAAVWAIGQTAGPSRGVRRGPRQASRAMTKPAAAAVAVFQHVAAMVAGAAIVAAWLVLT